MKQILFNTSMVKKILDGQKTVTRRAIKPQPKGAHAVLDYDDHAHTVDMICGNNGEGGAFIDWAETIKAPYWPGDTLWVRETWAQSADGTFLYKADDDVATVKRWHPSIHMPREATRLFLRVTDVRVKRLQDINLDPPGPDNQVIKEGLRYLCDFIAVWDATIRPADLTLYGWDANPWVWVIEFERISKESVNNGD